MTGEYWKTQEIAKAERERDKLWERLGIHSEEYIDKDREVKNLSSERKDEILEQKMTTAKAKKETWSILRMYTTNRSLPLARTITDNCKNFVSQKEKANGFIGLYRDVSNLKLESHERGMKMLNSRLTSEVVDPEVCQGFTTDKVRAALLSIKPTKAAGPDRIHPMFLHHLGPVSISLPMRILKKSWAETKVPQEWRVSDIRPIPKGRMDLPKIEGYRPISLTSTVGRTMVCLVTVCNIL